MRYKLLHIICLAFTVLLFACSRNDAIDESFPVTRAQLSIGLEDKGDVNRQEMIKTIRFIVFRNASGDVRLDVNKLVTMDTPSTATDIAVQDLEVKPNNDIMVIVIANEPQSLTDELDDITSLGMLQNMKYNIAAILNSDGEIVSSTGMPMTGVVRDISVVPDETKSIRMVIERAVARVDIFLEATNGGAVTGYTSGSISVTLHNLTHDSYFVMGNAENGTRDNANASKNYGKVIENVSTGDLLEKTWVAGEDNIWAYSSAAGAENRKLLCSFYTAERIFRQDKSDRLAVSMVNVLKGPPDTTGITGKVIETITKVDDNGSPAAQPFMEIRRNNVYQITARVGKVGIQILAVTVEDWGERQDINVNMDL